MSNQSALLRAEPHGTVGAVILRDAGVIIERWARRAAEEQAAAKRVHHDVLLDHLPTFLWELGRALSEGHGADPFRPCRPANIHGDQRWQVGWSVEEVVRDYQVLRVVVAEYLSENIARSLTLRESMALGVFIDDAIAASVSSYTACQAAAARPDGAGAAPQNVRHDDLLEVLAVIGHELRNPLAPLGNALELLKRGAADPVILERTHSLMDRQFRVMTRLVDDLLDLPRLLRGKIQVKPEQLDLAVLTRDVVDDRRAAYDAAGVKLALEITGAPLGTSGDGGRMSQVLGNLLGNALKFTDRGGEVVVRLIRDSARRVVVLSVRDTGIGIDPALLTKVFDPFVQADRSVERSRGGLGLGLALVRGVIELHGGTVRASSDGPGLGSEFVLELPLIDLPDRETAPVGAATEKLAPRRVLVIEDNRDSAESLKEYLELFGHRVAVAYSGTEGIERAKATHPEIVVCDIGLPGMSGYAVCAELRKIPDLVGTVFVALSGRPADDTPGSATQDVFDHHLLKPIEPGRLVSLIATSRSERSANPPQ